MEHKKLKEICSLIGYTINLGRSDYDIQRAFWVEDWYLDVREIIFTTEFIGKFSLYCVWTLWMEVMEFHKKINGILFLWLSNPVDYLYKILWLWEK